MAVRCGCRKLPIHRVGAAWRCLRVCKDRLAPAVASRIAKMDAWTVEMTLLSSHSDKLGRSLPAALT